MLDLKVSDTVRLRNGDIVTLSSYDGYNFSFQDKITRRMWKKNGSYWKNEKISEYDIVKVIKRKEEPMKNVKEFYINYDPKRPVEPHYAIDKITGLSTSSHLYDSLKDAIYNQDVGGDPYLNKAKITVITEDVPLEEKQDANETLRLEVGKTYLDDFNNKVKMIGNFPELGEYCFIGYYFKVMNGLPSTVGRFTIGGLRYGAQCNIIKEYKPEKFKNSIEGYIAYCDDIVISNHTLATLMNTSCYKVILSEEGADEVINNEYSKHSKKMKVRLTLEEID